MQCPYCEKEHPDNAGFCPTTGLKIEPVADVCQSCQRPIVPGAKFCARCGQPVNATTEPAAQPKKSLETIRSRRGLFVFGALGLLGVCLIIVGAWYALEGASLDVARAQFLPARTGTSVPAEESAERSSSQTPTDAQEQIASAPSATATASPQPSATNTAAPMPTPTATSTIKPSPTPSPTSALTNPADNAVLVEIPAGTFVMGSNPNSDPYFWGAESPQHSVYLDTYWIYRTEVTNAMYNACVEDIACPKPDWSYSRTRSDYFDNPAFDDYPVIFVTYTHAVAYCRWANGSLPTEAQWEKAARGEDLRLFPWGSNPPSPGMINFEQEDTAAVGSFPLDVSPYDVLDMAGNVWEWVFDYFQVAYYSISPEENPLGPALGSRRVIRGGAFFSDVSSVRVVARASIVPSQSYDTLGFRCVFNSLQD